MWGGYWFLFIVEFSLIEYEVCEIFNGYLVDDFHCFFISDVGICRFSRSSMLLV
jgi:hypothetical protein